MRTITILSGKGGVGKSSIAASLAIALSRQKKIICADCDVDASNLALLFGIKEKDYEEWSSLSTKQKAEFDHKKCDSSKKCLENCYFNAIEFKDNKPRLKEFSCEGCGVCELICPTKAITLKDVDNAKIGYADTRYGFKIVSAQLNIGESGSGQVVSVVKNKAKSLANDAEIMLVDSAAGVGCPVIASVTGSDYVILVTEPTPSGFSDMKRALEVVNHFRIKGGIIINKHDLNDEYTDKIEVFAERNNLKMIQKIPFDKTFIKAITNMIPIIDFNEEYRPVFKDIMEKILEELNR